MLLNPNSHNKDSLLGKKILDIKTQKSGILQKDSGGYFINIGNFGKNTPLRIRASDIMAVN